MFNWFGTDRDYKMPKVPLVTIPAADPLDDESPAYQVGKTFSGKITLRVGYSTLTMNNDAVDTLIRMLESAKDVDNKDAEAACET
jgi:hypothetical protein